MENENQIPGLVTEPQYLPELHQTDDDGNITHVGMVDPTSGQPMLVPADLHNQVFGQIPGASPTPPPTGGASGTWEPAPVSAPVTPNAPVAPYQSDRKLSAAPSMGTTTTTDTKTESADPEMVKKAKEALDKHDELLHSQADAAINENNVRAAKLEAESNSLAEFNQKQQAQRGLFEKDLADRQAKVQSLVDDASHTKIDANHYWATQGTGERVLAGLALALGALGQAKGGGTNPVLESIDNKIKQDIEIQKANLDQKNRNIAEQRGLVADFMKQNNDKEQAAQMAYATYWKSIANHFDSIAATAGNDTIRANAAVNSNEAKQKSAEALAKLNTTERLTKTVEAPLKPATKPMPTQIFDRYRTMNDSMEKINKIEAILDKHDTETGKLQTGKQKVSEFFGQPGNKDFVEIKSLLPELGVNHLMLQGRKVTKDMTDQVQKDVIGMSSDNTELLKEKLAAYKAQLQNTRNDMKRQAQQEGWEVPFQDSDMTDKLPSETSN